MFKSFVSSAVACLILSLAFSADEKTVATVNGQTIPLQTVEKFAIDWRGYEVVQELIVATLIEQEAKKLGIGLPEADLNREVLRQIEQFKSQLEPGKDVQQALFEVGAPESRVRLRAKINLLGERIALQQFKPTNYVEVKTILIRPQGPTMDALQQAITMSKEAHKKLVEGVPFEQVKAEYAPDPADPANIGYVGWRDIAVFPESVQAPLRTAKKGDFTEPTQTASGIQIFAVANTGKDAPEETLKQLQQQYLEAALPQLVERLKKEAKITINWPPK